MKNLKSLFFAAIVAIVGMGVVNAESSVRVGCENNYIGIGESTSCTVYATADQTALAQTTATFVVDIATSKYLNVSNVKANETLEFKQSGNPSSKKDTYSTSATFKDFDFINGYIFVVPSANLTVNKEFAVFSFTVTLSTEAKNLPEGNCGSLCVAGAYINGGVNLVSTGGSCPSFTINTQECTDKDCTPDTGSFMNYALLCGGAVVTLGAITLLNKKNKFYRV